MVRRVLFLAGSIALPFCALLALVGIFDALTPKEPGDSLDPGAPDRTITALARPGSRVDGQLCVTVQGQRLRARFELQVPAQASLVSELWQSGGPSGLDLVNAFFGTVRVAQFTQWPSHHWAFDDLGFGPPRLISDGRGVARIQAEGDPYYIGTKEASFSVAAPAQDVASGSRTITVDTRDMEIYAPQRDAKLRQTVTYGRVPKGVATDPACGMSLGTGVTRYVYLLNRVHKRRDGSDPPAAAFVLNRDHGASWWTSDVANDIIPGLDAVLWIGIGAFPYALAVWYLRRTRLRRTDLTTSLLCVFWLLVATGALWSARDLLSDSDVLRSVATGFAGTVTRIGEDFPNRQTSAPSVMTIDVLVPIGALAWPLMTWAVNRPVPARPVQSARPWWRQALTTLPFLATAVAAVAVALALSNWSHNRWATPWTFLVAAAIGPVITLALTVFLRNAGAAALGPWWAAGLGIATVGVAAIGPAAFTTLNRGWPYLAGVIYFVAVLSLAAGGLVLLLRIRVPWRSRPLFTGVSVAAYLLAVGTLIVPHAVGLLLRPGTSDAGPWNLQPLAQDLEALLYVVVLVGLLVALARAGAVRGIAGSGELHRTLGVLFVVLNLYWFDDRWLYLPISVLLGWLFAVRWLFPEKNAELARTVREDRAATHLSQRGEGEKLLELCRAERRYRALVTAGTGADLRQADKRLNTARKAAARLEPPLRERFFGVPDMASPWQLGKLGAVAGTGLGIPWMAIYLSALARDGFRFGVVGPERYPALWMFAQLFGVLTQWPMFGFALGYFFPYLRGANAVTKSLRLFVTVVVPPLVLSLLWWRRDMIEGNLWWSLQTLVFAAALGSILEYLMARRAGIEVSAYIELRGLSTVIGWGGVVVSAAITAAFALAQSTVSLVIQNLVHITPTGGPGG